MDDKYLASSYECLSSIGNSFQLESMMAEVVMTFFQSTKALFVGFFETKDSKIPMVFAGKDKVQDLNISQDECFLLEEEELHVVVLPLKSGYIKFIYDKESDIKNIYKMVCNFKRKINFALSACEGVKELEGLNDELEDRVRSSVEKIREHERMLMIQSKSAVMGEMLEMIAHQWRQPITSIGMISNNMIFNIIVSEDEEIDKELFKSELEDINKQVRYLSDTIDDFRNFFKESKSREEVFVSKVIEKSISLVKKQLEQSSITVEVDDRCGDVVLCTYKSELTQVLLNIISNAKDAFETQEQNSKKIVVECIKKANTISINIKDNAGGIKEEILLKIFEPYFSTKKQKNGTGLGLYMSKIIVNRHLDGEIYAKNIENGAMFSLEIPIKNYE